MAKKSAKPQYVEPENESQEMPETEGGQEGHGYAPITKSAAARAALDAGYEGPQEAVAYIKKTFGLEMGAQHFSAIKSQTKKAAGSATPKGKPGRKPKAASQAIEDYVAPPRKPRAPNGERDLIETLEALKPLIASHGADRLKRLVDLLG